MDKRGKRLRGRFRLTPCEPGQAGEHGLSFLEPDVRDLGAVAGDRWNIHPRGSSCVPHDPPAHERSTRP